MIKEFCAENFTLVPKALRAGATRIELCDNLAVGGTTPSVGVIEETIKYAGEYGASVMTIIRPRGGDFVYNDIELKIMERDILQARDAGSDGIVIGCLTKENWIDEEAMEILLGFVSGMQVTFHMAFDEIPASQQFAALDWLAAHDVQRVLTHGGSLSAPIEQHLERLKELKDYAGSRITILPGGGLSFQNVDYVAEALGVQEVHGTKIVAI